MPQPAATATQRRGKYTTSFRFGARSVDHAFEKKSSFAQRSSTPWASLSSPAARVSVVAPDSALQWTVTVTALIGAFSAFRDVPQPLGLIVHAAAAAILIGALVATRNWRRTGFTRIPTAEEDVVVIDDAEAPGILDRLEAGRRTALLADKDEGPQTVRDRLRRLRGMREAELLSDEELEAERSALFGRPAPGAATAPDERFVQRALGETVAVELGPRSMLVRTTDWFEGGNAWRVDYRSLKAPMTRSDSRYAAALAIASICWLGAIVFAMMCAARAGRPADYYVGGAGLTHAVTDLWPAFAVLFAGVAVIGRIALIRYFEPYPGVRLLRDSRSDAIAAAIEARRTAALRGLATPDPALLPREQAEIVEWLLEEELISPAERDAALQEAERVCGDPDLDRFADAPPKAGRARSTVH